MLPELDGGFVRSLGEGPDPTGRRGGGFPNPGGRLFITGDLSLCTSEEDTEKERKKIVVNLPNSLTLKIL